MWAGIGALASAAGQYYANAPMHGGPEPYKPSRHLIDKYNNIAFGDLKAYRQGGIEDPRLDHLGFGPGWREKVGSRMRDAAEGENTADAQVLGQEARGYGGPGMKSGLYIQNLMRLRAGRQRAIEGAQRDLELENFRQKKMDLDREMSGAGIQAGRLTGEFDDAEMEAYRAALQRHNAQADAIGAAIPQLQKGVAAMYDRFRPSTPAAPATSAPMSAPAAPEASPLWGDIPQFQWRAR